MTIYEAIANAGLVNTDPQWQGDRQRAGKKLCEWFYGHEKILSGGKLIRWASFGNLSVSNETIVWRSWEQDDQKLTKKERTETENEMLAKADQKAKEKKDAHEQTRQKCAKDFTNLSPGDPEIYLRRKSLGNCFGGKISLATTSLRHSQEPHIAIPLYDTDHKLGSFQHIYHEGDKTFEKGGKKSGLFFLLETPHHTWFSPTPETVHIAEGFATAASIQEALGDAAYCVCALDAGNLAHVGKAIRSTLPHTKIIFCADNDAFTKLPNGKDVNPGIDAANKAALACGGAVVYPDFGPQINTKFTDFNDLHCLLGLQIVKEQIVKAKSPALKNTYYSELDQLPRIFRDGKLQKPTAQASTNHLLNFFGNRICSKNRSIFVFKDTHWTELTEQGISDLYQKIDHVTRNELSPQELEAYLKHLKRNISDVPKNIDMFSPNPFIANFEDQTLHFTRNADGSYKLDARPHSLGDYITCVLPFKMPEIRGGAVVIPEATKFDLWLNTLWANDPDRDDKIKLFYQIGGCCILPAFTTMVFFVGPPASGKSTLIKLLIKLIGLQNTSSVQPCLWNGFNMEPMVGKLVNFDTDIDTNKPMNDSMVKKVIDRAPVSINRKNRDIVQAYLPPVHLFAGNDLPRSLDGRSRAYGRRLIILKTDSFKAPQGDITNDYEQILINHEKDAIVARLVAGVLDLINCNGNFKSVASSKELVEEMELNSDTYSQFIEEIKNEGIITENNSKIIMQKDKEISLKTLFYFYAEFIKQNSIGMPRSESGEKRRLASALKKLGFWSRKSNSMTLFVGFGASGNCDKIFSN